MTLDPSLPEFDAAMDRLYAVSERVWVRVPLKGFGTSSLTREYAHLYEGKEVPPIRCVEGKPELLMPLAEYDDLAKQLVHYYEKHLNFDALHVLGQVDADMHAELSGIRFLVPKLSIEQGLCEMTQEGPVDALAHQDVVRYRYEHGPDPRGDAVSGAYQNAWKFPSRHLEPLLMAVRNAMGLGPATKRIKPQPKPEGTVVHVDFARKPTDGERSR